MTADLIPPPLLEPCTTALVEGFQGSEYRSLSESWDETTARYSERRMRQRDAWWQARLREAVEKEREAILDLVDAYAKNNADLAAAIRARSQA